MAKYTQEEIDALGAKGHAFKNPDGHYSYPIDDEADLHNAIHAVGRGGASHDAIRKYITGRAKAMGMSSAIPDNWTSDGGSSAAVTPLETASLNTPFETLKRRRSCMIRKHERRGLPFLPGDIELRARDDGTGGTKYEFRGYAATFGDWFQVWDQWGDPYSESLANGGFSATLAGQWGGPDTRFYIGHNEAGLALARTAHGKWPGTMRMTQDSRGLEVNAPDLDGRNTEVRNMHSAIERGDVDGMSVGYVCRGQDWSDDYMRRTLTDLDLHNGDVSVVSVPANPYTAGAVMIPLSGAGGMRQRRPSEARAADDSADEVADSSAPPDYNPGAHGESSVRCQNGDCPVDGGALNAQDAKYCDQCGYPLYNSDGLIVADDNGVVDEVGGAMADADLLSMRLRLLEIA